MTFTQGNIFALAAPYLPDGTGNVLRGVVYEFTPDGTFVQHWFFTDVVTFPSSVSADHIAINNDIAYICVRGSSNEGIHELKSDGSYRKLVDFVATGLSTFYTTFDSDGNIYGFKSDTSHSGTCFKADKDTGVILQLWTIEVGNNNTYDSIWLMEDEKSLLIGTSFPDGWEGVLITDLSEGASIEAHEYARVVSPYDGNNFGYYFDMEDVAVIDGHIYVTTSPEGFGHDYDFLPVQRIGVGEQPQQPVYSSQAVQVAAGENEDEGFSIDCDPDGIGLWLASQSSDHYSIYKFNRDTGELLTALPLYFDDGSRISLRTSILFAIAGGGAHHGCGCCGQPPVVRRRVPVSTVVGAT